MKRLIIVRHGETEENRAGVIQGHIEGTLSELGHKQIRSLAERLRSEPIDVVVSSDLRRAVETASAIAAYHNLEVRIDKGLRERCYGIFEGRSRAEYRRALSESGMAHHIFKPQGSESVGEVLLRCQQLLERAFKEYHSKVVLFSSHGGTNRCLLATLLGFDIEQFWSNEQENTCVNIIDFNQDGRGRLVQLNDCTHLNTRTS